MTQFFEGASLRSHHQPKESVKTIYEPLRSPHSGTSIRSSEAISFTCSHPTSTFKDCPASCFTSDVCLWRQQLGLAHSQQALVLVEVDFLWGPHNGQHSPGKDNFKGFQEQKNPGHSPPNRNVKLLMLKNKGWNPDYELQRDSAVSHPPSPKGYSEKKGCQS